jgi:hypothetical protein
MILGLFALNDSFDWSPKPARDILWLLLTVNIYEWSLIGLAAFLWRRGIYRDGVFLLVIEAFFLVDVGFLNMEIFTIDPVLGLLVNAALLLLGVATVAVAFRLANLPIASGLFAFASVQLLALTAIPGLLADAAMRDNGYLDPSALYVAWWLAGAMPVLAIALARPVMRAAEFALLNRWGRVVAPVMVALPFLSLAAHLALNHWVYKSQFALADVSPVFLGLAVLAARCDAAFPALERRRRFAMGLPIVAVALAVLSPPDLLTFNVGIDLSSLRLTLLAAAGVCVDGGIRFRHWNFALLGCGYLTAAGMGPTVPAMAQTGEARATSTLSFVKLLVPRTSTHWGVLSVALAFVLLAIGAAVSVLRSAARSVIGTAHPQSVEALPPTPYDPPMGTPVPLAPPGSSGL